MKEFGASCPGEIGQYQVLAELGRGGMGRVLRAEVIGVLAQERQVGLDAADTAAELGISRRQVYLLVRRWRAGGGVATDLLLGHCRTHIGLIRCSRRLP